MNPQELENNLDYWLKNINKTTSFKELEQLKSDLLGKSGTITLAFKTISEVSVDEKKLFGERLNKIKSSIEDFILTKKKELEEYSMLEKLKNETLDITLPIKNNKFGGLHIITQAIRRIRNHYLARGFSVLDGPEIENDFFNFDALNMPKHHPARQSHDTFYLKEIEDSLLRTHTSCVQIRTMLNKGANVRMISIGKTYRNDALDATHSPMFHQVECLVVDKKPINIGHLKSELRRFVSFFFEVEDIAIRFRPSFFPFTEPGMEVDCKYFKKEGKLIISKDGDKWLEIGGAGMVHPNVFKACNIEQPAYGFAFGVGLERLIMLKSGIKDIRNLFDTDNRWLKYYGQ
ncbi:MAG: phenylalanine--tRNA ligase subunit alpha [Holosporales bacterium]|jgi:phenylalanyl-tRNA synthetase alpha chain|nr:phenylalanine--tRNA ligase subunit alpha [Holosporales bacterium]